jgi:hypothetical protein
MENTKSTRKPRFSFPRVLALGIALGALLMLGLSEERRLGTKKTLCELKELPFRFLL